MILGLLANVAITTMHLTPHHNDLAEEAVFLKTDRGQIRLQDADGQIYQIVETSSTGRSYWRCQYARKSDLKCKAKASSVGAWIVTKRGFHNH